MKSFWLSAIVAGMVFQMTASGAFAADLPGSPVYKATPVAIAGSSFYAWADGTYDSVHLPAYGLGFKSINALGGDTDSGPVQSFDHSLNGGGIRGAIGYVMPGSNTRFELGGSYIGASGSLSQSTSPTTPPVGVQFLGGGLGAGSFLNCGASPFTCATAGALSTSYSAWQVNGKMATDLKYDLVTLTPSAALFGGNSRASQTLSQSLTQFDLGAVDANVSYSASTSLQWTDVGARVGLDASVPLTNAFAVGLGGWVGYADRRTTLTGSDSAIGSGGFLTGNSTISTGASKGVFLADAEAGAAYSITSMLTLRGFVGLNYDAGVPGVAGPTFSGNVSAPTSIAPAGINYTGEVSYYAGGGLLAKF